MEVATFIEELATIVGEKYIITNPIDFYTYVKDYSTGKLASPMCIVRPNSTAQISKIAKFCNDHGLRITVRGGGSGVSGGCLTDESNIIVSLDRLNRIIEINEIDRYVVAEAGVVTQVLQDSLKERNLFFPQNISSASLSFIGGNVAVSSGSPKSLKYGSTKNYVINLEVVLPNGEVIWTGKNVKKNATGYNLTQLFVGSEGTLGIITKVVLQIVPVKKEALVYAPFSNLENLFSFVEAFFKVGMHASSLEFLDKNGCRLVFDYLQERFDEKATQGALWIEFESDTDEENLAKIEALYTLLSKFTDQELLIGQTQKEIENLWKYRKKIGEAAMNHGHFHDLDIVVPRSKSSDIYAIINYICTSLDLEFVVVGHIGDGNFHINIFKDQNINHKSWADKMDSCISFLFEKVIAVGGEISGEHGVGTHNKTYFQEFTAKQNLHIMKGIKKVFDPKNILNTNNIFFNY
ncbi:glycolate oxidase [Kordia periserrulae]|uniref:Glycolate oxidase n=1 Tax=Kordia periserrulae TaxID=701523 RepID=A0A2T6BZF9_9FLAO|nr:FAD-binding oxidoreductase [Kordia periserrulae]PTX61377.1 glycolate oxidase [Kordia periserrulae]